MIQTSLTLYSWGRFFPLHKKEIALSNICVFPKALPTGWRKNAQLTMVIWGAMAEGGRCSSH